MTNSEVLDGVLLGRVSLENVNWNMGVRKMTDSGRVTRRFPPPWSVEERQSCFIVKDGNGQTIAYVYF